MPLLFKSLSHGEIPFGFFNIETDMLLLNDYFFFAGDMAEHVIDLASQRPGEYRAMYWDVYVLEEKQIGNLMGAITGVDLWGFIGEVYGQFPFPCREEEFKQHPEGSKNRDAVENIVRRYAPLTRVKVVLDPTTGTVMIGDYLFDNSGFRELLTYLWLGGYPRWMGGARPDYIERMRKSVEDSGHPSFGFKLE